MNKKILHIITQGEWGGAQRYVYDLATGLSPRAEITVAVGELRGQSDLQSKLLEFNKKNGGKINVEQLGRLQREISPVQDFLAILQIRDLYKKIRPDVVHLSSSKAGILGSLAAATFWAKPRPKVIYTAHGWVFNEPLSFFKKNIYKFLERITSCFKDKIIVLSERDLSAARSIGIPKNKISKISLGAAQVAALDKSTARAKLGQILQKNFSESDFIFGAIANFYPTKGIPNLLSAATHAKENISNLKIILIGDGRERKIFEESIRKNDLSQNVFLAGPLPDAALYAKAFDCLVIPSNKEGLPYVLLEAIAQKLPVIATKVGGIPELIRDQKTGILVEPNDPHDLAKALVFAHEHRERLTEIASTSYEQNKYLLDKESMINSTSLLY